MGWSDEELVRAHAKARSMTDMFRVLNVPRTPNRVKQMQLDMDRLGLEGFRVPSKWPKELLERAVKESLSFAEVYRRLGGRPHGSSQHYLKLRCTDLGIDCSHFGGWQTRNLPKKSTDEVLVNDETRIYREPRRRLRPAMLSKGISEECKICGLGEWLSSPIVLTIDHKDGNWKNNEIRNLRFLCPNCHSQTETYGNKRRKEPDVIRKSVS